MSPEERRRRESSVRHALVLAERLRSPKEAERLLAVAVANDDEPLARAVLFQARSRGWELIVGRLGRRPADEELDSATA